MRYGASFLAVTFGGYLCFRESLRIYVDARTHRCRRVFLPRRYVNRLLCRGVSRTYYRSAVPMTRNSAIHVALIIAAFDPASSVCWLPKRAEIREKTRERKREKKRHVSLRSGLQTNPSGLCVRSASARNNALYYRTLVRYFSGNNSLTVIS